MALNASRKNIASLLARKNASVIPQDQQKLLEEEDSWEVELKNRPEDLIRVPRHVLQSVVDASLASRKRATSDRDSNPPGSPRPQKLARTSTGTERTRPEELPPSSPEDVLSSSPPPQSHPERFVSWAPSSAASEIRDSVGGSSPVLPPRPDDPDEIASQVSPERVVPSSPALLSQLGCRSSSPIHAGEADPGGALEGHGQTKTPSREAKSAIRHRHHLIGSVEYPSSGPEDGLETQLPMAQILPQPSVNQSVTPRLSNKSTKLSTSIEVPENLSTPPCAQASQPVIPATVIRELPHHEQSAQKAGVARRRMKPILFSDPDNGNPETTTTVLNYGRMAPTKVYPPVTSSNPISSSMIVPATIPRSPPSNHNNLPTEPIQEPPDVITDSNETLPEAELDAKEDVSQDKPSTQRSSHTEDVEIPLTLPSTIPPSNSNPLPFDLFSQSYPSYVSEHQGSAWSFVRACVCLDHMLRSNSLRDYLWDDFIRAFSSEYVDYARKVENPMPALEWFNSLSGAPVFNKMVVRRDNIAIILDSHSGIVERAKTVISQSSGDQNNTQTTENENAQTQSTAPRISETERAQAPKGNDPSPTIVEENAVSTGTPNLEDSNIGPTIIAIEDDVVMTPPIANPEAANERSSSPRAASSTESLQYNKPRARSTLEKQQTPEIPDTRNSHRQLGSTGNPPIPSSARSTARSSMDTAAAPPGSNYLKRLASGTNQRDKKRQERLREHFRRKKSGSTNTTQNREGSH